MGLTFPNLLVIPVKAGTHSAGLSICLKVQSRGWVAFDGKTGLGGAAGGMGPSLRWDDKVFLRWGDKGFLRWGEKANGDGGTCMTTGKSGGGCDGGNVSHINLSSQRRLGPIPPACRFA